MKRNNFIVILIGVFLAVLGSRESSIELKGNRNIFIKDGTKHISIEGIDFDYYALKN